MRRSDFCIAGRSGARRVSGNTGEPRDEPASKKRPAHSGCVLACARFVAALDRCTRIALHAAPCGSPRESATQTDSVRLQPALPMFRHLALGVLIGSAATHAYGAEDTDAPFYALFGNAAELARASQPEWSSPLVTTTGLLEQRFRFDVARQHVGNGADITALDGGRGIDLIVSGSNEIQIGLAPNEIRSAAPGAPGVVGFGDWPFMRIEQRLASGPRDAGDYVLTTWLQLQAPVGVSRLTNHSWIYTPTLAFGKGWGAFDVQGTVGVVLPASHTATLGNQLQSNLALQYHLLTVLWPELEANWTWYTDGQRGGLNQLYLTAGLVVGRFQLTRELKLTLGGGYQFAVAPDYRPKPLTPAYQHTWLFTSRVNF